MDPLYLYTRPGCHLCDDARAVIDAILAERAAAGQTAPTVVERDIETDDAWQHAFLNTIPVLELGGHRLELAVSPARIRRLLADALDEPAAASA